MGVGRPKLLNPQSRRFEMRLTDSEFFKIANIADKLKISKREAILRGIDLLINHKPKKYKSFAKSKTTNEPGVVRGIIDDD